MAGLNPHASDCGLFGDTEDKEIAPAVAQAKKPVMDALMAEYPFVKGYASGMAVGLMNADTFVENDGAEINVYERVNVTLYFASEDGEHLIAGQRSVVYNTNVSMEKMVMEQLIKGPALAGYYPTVNPDTKILSVTNKDGTCYVNLSDDFLKQQFNISNDVVVYSIAN